MEFYYYCLRLFLYLNIIELCKAALNCVDNVNSRVENGRNYIFDNQMTIRIPFVYFDFYEKVMESTTTTYRLIDMSSSRDLLTSYHGHNNRINNSNGSNDSYETFKSLFSNDIQLSHLILEGNVFYRTQMSRILFKRARFDSLSVYKLTNSTVRKNLFELVQTDDLFDFD